MNHLLLLTLTLVFLNASASTSGHPYQHSVRNECPAPEDIPKCGCSLMSGGLSVTCSHFESDSDFQDHLNSLHGYSLKKLNLKDITATSLSTDIWKGLETEQLSLTKFNVEDASFRRGKRHFQGLEKSLQRLDISGSFRKGQRPLLNLQLDHLENLKEIILERNGIPEVGNDWFTSGPKKMTVLIFEKNNIEELGDRAFSSLSNLRLLAVAGNHINSISRTMLPQSANMLKTLDLAYNKIRTLPEDIFSGMPSLEDVNLDYNLIHMIREDTWSSISSQLTSLSLEGTEDLDTNQSKYSVDYDDPKFYTDYYGENYYGDYYGENYYGEVDYYGDYYGNMLQCDGDLKWMCDTRLANAIGKCGSPVEKKGVSVKQFCSS